MATSFSRFDAIEEKFEKIFEFASEHPEFDTEFIDSVYEYFEREGDVSDKQLLSLNRIMEQWGME
jgi:hypothetical protein